LGSTTCTISVNESADRFGERGMKEGYPKRRIQIRRFGLEHVPAPGSRP
jgi:hypothetical protein